MGTRMRGIRSEPVRRQTRQASVGLHGVVQPAADVVAGAAAACQHLVMAAAAAQIARPTGVARRLRMHMALGQPVRLFHRVYAAGQRAELSLLVADETMARGQIAPADLGIAIGIAGEDLRRIGQGRTYRFAIAAPPCSISASTWSRKPR